MKLFSFLLIFLTAQLAFAQTSASSKRTRRLPADSQLPQSVAVDYLNRDSPYAGTDLRRAGGGHLASREKDLLSSPGLKIQKPASLTGNRLLVRPGKLLRAFYFWLSASAIRTAS